MFETLKMFDRALLLKINSLHSPLADTFMWGMSQSWHTYAIVLLAAFAFYKKYALKKAAEFILGCAIVVACADGMSNISKHSVKRFRPTHNIEIKAQINVVNNYEGGKYGFFSAHAANAFGIITFIFLSARLMPLRYRLMFFIYPAIIGYSRVYLGVHYPSDVFVGSLVGILFGYLIYLIFNKHFFKFENENVA